MEFIGESLAGLPWFLAYFATGAGMTLVYVFVYTWVTPHSELALIRDGNQAAALAFVGSLIGFCLPLASAMAHSVALVDCVIWGVIALVIQVAIFFVVRLPIPGISERIEKDESASGLWLGATSLAGGLLNAAAMTT
jgi:putative membrane protein